MSDAKPVSVRILEKEYLVACPEEEQADLLASARFLDRRMREIRDTGRIVGLDRIAVMAALNITHELLNNQSQNSRQSDTFGSRIRLMQEKIEMALHKGKQMEL